MKHEILKRETLHASRFTIHNPRSGFIPLGVSRPSPVRGKSSRDDCLAEARTSNGARRLPLLKKSGPLAGFTLVEILITVGLMVIISSASLLSLYGRRGKVDLDNTARQMAALLREAQSRAVSQASSSAWGVHFENSTSTTPFYAIFAGTYATTSRAGTHPLPSAVVYVSSSLAAGAVREVIFTRTTGAPSASTSVAIALRDGLAQSSTVSVASSGLVSF